MFQDDVLAPYLMSYGIELHPGMFFSVPVIATLRIIYVQAMRARLRRVRSVR